MEQYSNILETRINTPFNAFLKIGLANESNLPMPPVEWAKTLTRGLLYSLKWAVPHLIKRMCDEQEQKLELDANLDADAAWVYWRAPSFVHMHPSGNSPFDAAAAWHRSDDAEFTEVLLRGLTGKMVEPAWFKLNRLAGEAYVSLASVPDIEPGRGMQDQPSTNSAEGAVGPNREIAQAKERVRHFEAEIAAIDTKIAAFQQSLTHAIVNGASTFKPLDISKAISKLHANRKELEFRKDDWGLMLKSALSRTAVPTQQERPAKSTAIENHDNGLASAGDVDAAIVHDMTLPDSDAKPAAVPVTEEGMIASRGRPAQPNRTKLPAKAIDLSKYLEGSGLTDRQCECFSLKFEYGLRVSEIVSRLGISRKTVDEHIAAAKRRIGWSQTNERKKANKARVNPAE